MRNILIIQQRWLNATRICWKLLQRQNILSPHGAYKVIVLFSSLCCPFVANKKKTYHRHCLYDGYDYFKATRKIHTKNCPICNSWERKKGFAIYIINRKRTNFIVVRVAISSNATFATLSLACRSLVFEIASGEQEWNWRLCGCKWCAPQATNDMTCGDQVELAEKGRETRIEGTVWKKSTIGGRRWRRKHSFRFLLLGKSDWEFLVSAFSAASPSPFFKKNSAF